MRLIYNGALDERTSDMVRDTVRKYAYFVEIRTDNKFWDIFHNWSKDHLVLYNSWGEDCMGQKYEKSSHCYSTFPKNGEKDDRFFAFKSRAEKEFFVRDFSNIIINADPFVTEI
jgi:hypothetical protein